MRFLQAIFIGVLCLPFATSALTAQELSAQINDLLGKIQTLQAQIGTPSGTIPTTPTIPTAGGSCPHIGRVLKIGSSGADVTRLQQFLSLDPSVYPEKSVTGYYGALTEAAVKRFQCKNKIVCDGDANSTGYGVTGPRTAAILSLQCPGGGTGTTGGSGQVSGFIKVTPTTGPSPLTVTIEATVNTANICSAATYTVDYGDGTAPGVISVPQNGCSEMRQVFSHTYTKAGTYQVLLRSGTHQVSATVVVQQGSSIPTGSDVISGSPTSGATPLTVTFTGLVNASASCSAGPYRIDFGDNQSATIAVAGCSVTNFSVPHTYSNSGSYIARLYRGNPAVNIASVGITAGGSASNSGGALSVSSGTSGNPLQVRATFHLASSCARYDLDWGDGSAHAIQSEGSCATGSVNKDLTHTYSGAGAYTVTLKRGASLTSSDTAGITIVQ